MVNRFIKSALSLGLAAGLTLSLPSTGALAAPTDTASTGNSASAAPTSKLQATVDALQPGWNMGNTFDAVGCTPKENEDCWGNPKVTQDFLHALKQQGYKSLRLPVTWYEHEGPAPSYTITPSYLARVQQVTKWAMAEGFYVIVDMHHDDYVIKMPTNHDAVLAQYNAGWTQIAAAFKNYASPKLLLESFNEPRFSDDWSANSPEFFGYLNELNTSFVHIVRASGGKNKTRPLILPSITSDSAQVRLDALASTITALNDPNIIATVHYYGYYSFGVNRDNHTTFEAKPGQSTSAKDDIEQTFDRVYNTFVAKGVPVLVGEWGLLSTDNTSDAIEHGEWLKYIEYLEYYAHYRHLPLMLWDNNFYFNRNSYTWNDPELFAMMKAGWKGRSSTAASDLIDLTQGATITDQSVNLNLNGNTLKSITFGNRKLKAGTEYTLVGSKLTFSAAILTDVTRNGKLGLNGKLVAKFSKGADWAFRVNQIATPVLSATTGTTTAFTLPAQFNGDALRTVKTTYSDGTFAAPDDWTAYKQYFYVFTPNYPDNTITLKTPLLGSLKEAPLVLEFDFDSGAKVTYTLTRSGDTVTGAPGGTISTPAPTPSASATPTVSATPTPSDSPIPATSATPTPAISTPAPPSPSAS